ncbi:MAG: serine hydrolase, partial [Alphaproteobacteria bacterium]|nr:serine hydrolase [Alphaproteobacteria bacterium]
MAEIEFAGHEEIQHHRHGERHDEGLDQGAAPDHRAEQQLGRDAERDAGDEPADQGTGTMLNNLWSFAREMKGWPAFPANLGLGFFIRGEGMIPTWIGHLASPGAYGGMGAGSTNFWIDPDKDMVMVCLTAGLLEETNSQARFQRLSDVA